MISVLAARAGPASLAVSGGRVLRRSWALAVTGPRQEAALACQAADALMAITGKLGQFREEGRFTTWAYGFVILEVSAELGRHFWRRPNVPLEAQGWD